MLFPTSLCVSSSCPPEKISVLPNNALDPKNTPIFMGLRDKTYALTVESSGGGQPQLKIVVSFAFGSKFFLPYFYLLVEQTHIL